MSPRSAIDKLHNDLVSFHNDFSKLSAINFFFAKAQFTELSDYEKRFRDIVAENPSAKEEEQVTDKMVKSVKKLIHSVMGHFYKLEFEFSTAHKRKDKSPQVSKTKSSLAPIPLPKFSGRFSDFPNFIATFKNLVDSREDLDNAEKFHYLLSCLIPNTEPYTIISEFMVDFQNYELALTALTRNYDNKRRRAFDYVSKVLTSSPVKSGEPAELKSLVAQISSAFTALEGLNLASPYDFLKFSILYFYLDTSTRDEFNKYLPDPCEIPTFETLTLFLERRVKIEDLKGTTQNKPKGQGKSKSFSLITQAEAGATSSKQVATITCFYCNGQHKIYFCDKFSSLDLNDKLASVKKNNRCYVCLGAHRREDCKSQAKCKICNSDTHHTLIHRPKIALPPQGFSTPNPQGSKIETRTRPAVSTSSSEGTASPQGSSTPCKKGNHSVSSLNVFTTSNQVLLGSIRLFALDSEGNRIQCCAIVDTGSQRSLISSSLYQKLGLQKRHANINLSGIGSSPAKCLGESTVNFKDIAQNFSLTVKTLVVSKICRDLPEVHIPDPIFQKLQTLHLADPLFHHSKRVDVLLGLDCYSKLIVTNSQPLTFGNLVAHNSPFGYVILGSSKKVDESESEINSLVCVETDVDKILTKFWEIEDFQENGNLNESAEDEYVEQYFQKTTMRSPNGQYIVRYPLKPNIGDLGTNRKRVIALYSSMSERLNSQVDLAQGYNAVFLEYLQLNHMVKAPSCQPYLLSHHAVVRQFAASTKIRAVFNASLPDDKGNSLNDFMYIGPKLHNDISHVLISFRLRPVCFIADLRMMFRNILLHQDDRKFQHILWRESPTSEITEYELTTVTFGVNASPFLAQRVIKQLAQDHGDDFPLAKKALTRNIFVDDVVVSCDSLEEALRLKHELIALCTCGGFTLHKWSSNEASLSSQDDKGPNVEFDSSHADTKVLGLNWNFTSDQFYFKFEEFSGPFTKRNTLRYLGRIYDPLALLAPFVFKIKCFIQNIWKAKLGWDDELPLHLKKEWEKIFAHVSCLKEVSLPRLIIPQTTAVSLIGFADASMKGYCAVVYIRTLRENDTVSTHIVKAKTRVAPIAKPLTIPKLELCGVLLLAQLYSDILKSDLGSFTPDTILCTDSMIALHWLKNPSTADVFVKNRVQKIGSLTPAVKWRHVPTELNPADVGCRGLNPASLIHSNLWFHGPPFLNEDAAFWPLKDVSEQGSQIDGPKNENLETVALLAQKTDLPTPQFERYSSYIKLLNVYAYLLRFPANCKKARPQREFGPLTVPELEKAEKAVVRLQQRHDFEDELKCLKSEMVAKGTKNPMYKLLLQLGAFLDPEGLLRVGGRLENNPDLSYDEKHPLLLKGKTHLAQLIVLHHHVKSLHSGCTVTQNSILSKFWIVRSRPFIKSLIKKCLVCFRMSSKPVAPIMGPLPAARTMVSRCFTYCGVDLAGPLTLKETSRRKAALLKGWLCLFVCFSTKAVHLELVTSLSTEAFTNALDRFVSRRGLPKEIYSDQGTNFVGCARELKDINSFLDSTSDKILTYLATKGVVWKFNAPKHPSSGGLWERNIGKAKNLLYKTVGTHALTFEEYTTLFTRIEAVLNSTPLVFRDEEVPTGLDFLTPAHFLIGSSLLSLPQPECSETMTPKNRFFLLKQLNQMFWRRYSREYLHTLSQKYKWFSPRKECDLRPGTLVYVSGETTHPLSWPLGKVEETFPGKDGVVRLAKVKFGGSSLIRPVSKLVVVPQDGVHAASYSGSTPSRGGVC